MNLAELVEIQTEFDKRHGSREPFFVKVTSENPRDLEHLVVCMVGELGEFANILKKVTRGDLGYREAEPQLQEEFVDLFIYMLKVAGQTGIDIESAYLKKLRKNEIRFSNWSQ